MGDSLYLRPCFDSSVFISGLDNEICRGIKRGVIYRYLIEEVKAEKYRILISAVALAEVYEKKRFVTPDGLVLDEFLELVEEDFIDVIEVDREIGIEAHRLCRKYRSEGLMPVDAIHLACALRAGSDVLLTWDGPLATVKHDKIRIEEPRIIHRNLFAETEIATDEEIKDYEEKQSAAGKTRLILVPSSTRRCGGDPATNESVSDDKTDTKTAGT